MAPLASLEPSQSPQSVESLSAWIREAGGFVGSISVDHPAGMERRMVATRDILEGELLLALPQRILFTSHSAASNPIAGRWCTVEEVDKVDLLCIQLLEELELRAASRWAVWLATLPAAYDTPFLWDATTRAALRCADLTRRVDAQRATAEANFASIRRLAAERRLPLPPSFTLHRYLWAIATVRTRGATLVGEAAGGSPPTGEWALCPLGDMFNHAADACTRCCFDRDSATYRYVAGAHVRAGGEVLVCYGAHDDSVLLEQYGFVLAGNPHSRVRLAEEGSELPERVAAWLHEQSLDLEGLHLSAEGGSWELMAALRLKHATEQEMEHGAAFAVLEGEPISPSNERLVLAALLRLARARAQLFGTPARRRSPRLSSPPGAPTLLRTGWQPLEDGYAPMRARCLIDSWVGAQRQLLSECIEALEQQMRSLPPVSPSIESSAARHPAHNGQTDPLASEVNLGEPPASRTTHRRKKIARSVNDEISATSTETR